MQTHTVTVITKNNIYNYNIHTFKRVTKVVDGDHFVAIYNTDSFTHTEKQMWFSHDEIRFIEIVEDGEEDE